MSSLLELQAAKVKVGQSGQEGTKGIFPIDVDKIVTTANMKVGAYTIAAQPTAPCLISVSVTAVGATDTMGTITIAGTDINGTVISEVVTPIVNTTVCTTKEFASVTSATGAGWVINETADTVTIGVADVIVPTGYYFGSIQVISQAVVASQTALSGSIVAELTDFTALPAGTYPTKLTKIALTSGQAIGILSTQ